MKNKFIRVLRICIALVIGYITENLIKKYYGIPVLGWVDITVVVVLFEQESLGGTIKKGWYRFLATASAGLIGILVLWLFRNNNILIDILFFILCFCYGMIFMNSNKQYVGLLGIATLIIALIVSNKDPHIAAWRVLDIGLGILISIICIVVIFPPLSSHQQLSNLFKNMGQLLEEFTKEQVDFLNIDSMPIHLMQSFENNIIKQIQVFEKVIGEGKYELPVSQKIYSIRQLEYIFIHFRSIFRILFVLLNMEIINNVTVRKKIHTQLTRITLLLKNITQELQEPNSIKKETLLLLLNDNMTLLKNELLADDLDSSIAVHCEHIYTNINRIITLLA